MSWEIYIQGWLAGKKDGATSRVICTHLGVRELPQRWKFCGRDWIFSIDASDHVTDITIYRPSGELEERDLVFRILQAGLYVTYGPGARMLATSDLTEHLCEGMVEALGKLVVISSSADLATAYFT